MHGFSALVAQLDRVPGYEPGGRGFESCRARHRTNSKTDISMSVFLLEAAFFPSVDVMPCRPFLPPPLKARSPLPKIWPGAWRNSRPLL
jgi:hypothetical protein